MATILLLASLSQAWSAVAAAAPADAITHAVSGQPERTWVDNTGRYQTRGKLVGWGPYYVRLLKTNGRYSTVPTRRLSLPDRRYVEGLQQTVRGFDHPRLPAAPAGGEPEIRFDPRWLPAEPPAGMFEADVVLLRISEQLIADLARRSYQQDDTVGECILGYPVSGNSHTEASSEVQLAPGNGHARLNIPVRGTVTSDTVTYAEVGSWFEIFTYSLGTTWFHKQIDVTIDERGIDIDPQPVRLQSQREITGICSSLGGLLGAIAEQIAYRQAMEQKPMFDAAADQLTRRRIDQSVDRRIRQAINTVNRLLRSAVKTFEQAPEPFQLRPRFSTTDRHFYLVLSRHVASQSDVPPPAPPLSSEPPFVAQIHTSLVREAITDAEVIQWLMPILERLRQGQGAPRLEQLRQQIRQGRYRIRWSPDRAWVTVYWYPPSATAGRDDPSKSRGA